MALLPLRSTRTISHDDNRNQHQEKVVAKRVCLFRLRNERDILLHFQNRTPFIRPLIDGIEDSSVPPTLILRYLHDDVLRASNRQRLTRIEVKYVAKRVLKALSVLHDEGFVHTGIIPPNQAFVRPRLIGAGYSSQA